MAAAGAFVTVALAGCAPAGADADSPDLTTVTVALDYVVNNASFAGFFAAQENGYYADAGLDVVINGYTSTASDVLVDAGQADFGTLDQGSLIIGRAAGEDIVAVAALLQHDPQRFVVAPGIADSVSTVADLEGRTYGGFGLPIESAINTTALKNDGQAGQYQNVVLGTDAYTALVENQVDWSIVYDTDDILWWTMDGLDMEVIDYRDYNVPDMYGKTLISSQGYLDDNPETATAFVEATLQGYAWAQEHPAESVELMVAAGIGPLDVEKQIATAEALASDYWLADDGTVGTMDAARWDAYGAFMAAAGVLADETGEIVTDAPDTTTYFTDQYLGSGE